TVPRSQFLQAGQAPGEFGPSHMVGVAADGGIAPDRIELDDGGAALASESPPQQVKEPRRTPAVSHRPLAEQRQAAGARKAPHVRQDLYSVMAQQGDEVLDRAGRMAQGPDGLRLGHVTCLLRTWVPVFCDRQRRGRLCRQSAGRPPVPGLGWRDRQPRTGGELWKPWNCIAADCWIMCNWWCAICPPLNASIPLSPPGWAYRSAGVARALSGSMSWCSRRWTRRRHS